MAVEPVEPRQPEEPGPDGHAHAVDADGPRVEIEPVEARLGARQRSLLGAQALIGVRTIAALPSCSGWKS
jgi:hypothetical protein